MNGGANMFLMFLHVIIPLKVVILITHVSMICDLPQISYLFEAIGGFFESVTPIGFSQKLITQRILTQTIKF